MESRKETRRGTRKSINRGAKVESIKLKDSQETERDNQERKEKSSKESAIKIKSL